MTGRCEWLPLNKPDYVAYHDNEWGVPVHDDHLLFEMLILEGAQAGLSWYNVLKRREGYRAAFYNFDPKKVAAMSDPDLEAILKSGDVIKNRLKVYSTRQNASAFLAIQADYGSFNNYIWGYVDNRPIINNPATLSQMNSKDALSDKISRDLKSRGMSFVGTTIIYAYLQAIGIINDHMTCCFKNISKSNK